MRTPKTPFYSVANGALTMKGGDPLGDRQGVPGFVGRRQQHAIADVSTTLRFTPTRDGARAGLVAMQNDYAYLFFGLTRSTASPHRALQARGQEHARRDGARDADRLRALHAQGAGDADLHAKGGTMGFDYESGGKRATLTSDLDTRFLSTARAGGFVGTVVGPYVYNPK